MPRLVDWTSLGQGPASSQRPIADIQTNALEQGVNALSQGIKSFGGNLANIANQQAVADQQISTANADAYLLRQRDAFNESIRDKPTEHASWEKQFSTQAPKWMQEAGALIPNARARALWQARQQSWIESNRANINKSAFETGKKEYMDFNNGVISEFQDKYLKAGEEDKARYRETVNGMFDDYVARGYINEGQAKEMKKQWAEGTALRWVQSQPASERLAVLGGTGSFRYSLKGSESSQKAGVVNGLGYAGLYQFGAPRLQTIGVYTPGSGENLTNWSKTSKDAPGKWSGTFNIPGFPEVKTLQDFRNNPAAQEKVADLHFAEIDKQIAARGLDKYIGQEVGGVKITRDSIHAMAHLGGIGNAAAFLTSGGKSNSADRNNTSMRDYAAKFSRGTGGQFRSGTMADIIPADKREALIRNAEVENNRINRQEQQRIGGLVNDDITAMRQTGVGIPDTQLNREMIAKHFGEDKAQEWEATRMRNRRYFEAMDGVESLPEAEIDRRVKQLEPAGRSKSDTATLPEDALVAPETPRAGYAEDYRIYAEAQKAAEKIKQARRADPALAVQSTEPVRAAMENRQYEEINGVKSVTPQSAQAMIAARLNAQVAMGIDNPLAVTRSEAMVIARHLRSIGNENPDGMNKFMGELRRVYGEHAESVLSSTLQLAGVNRELSNFTTEILGKLASGIRPTEQDALTMEALNDANAMDALIADWGPDTGNPTRSMTPGAMRRAIQSRQQQTAQQPASPAAKPDNAPVANWVTPQGTKDARNLLSGTMAEQDFDRKYGAGSGKKVLEELKRRMGDRNSGVVGVE